MSYFPWSEEYSVHLQVIDADHKDLVDTVNSLHEAIKNGGTRTRIGQIINDLVQYVDVHFSREEAMMEKYSYPDIAQHKRIHRHLTRTVHAIRVIFNNEPKNIDPNKLLQFLKEWLIHHILDEDTRYAPYIPGDEAAEDSSPDGNGNDGRATKTASGQIIVDEKVMTLTVPTEKTVVLRRCAGHLTDGGKESKAIEEIVTPVFDKDMGYAPSMLQGEQDQDDDAAQTVALTVPVAKAAILRGCAKFLMEGSAQSIAIEHIVMPDSKMTFDDAMRFARPILR